MRSSIPCFRQLCLEGVEGRAIKHKSTNVEDQSSHFISACLILWALFTALEPMCLGPEYLSISLSLCTSVSLFLGKRLGVPEMLLLQFS